MTNPEKRGFFGKLFGKQGIPQIILPSRETSVDPLTKKAIQLEDDLFQLDPDCTFSEDIVVPGVGRMVPERHTARPSIILEQSEQPLSVEEELARADVMRSLILSAVVLRPPFHAIRTNEKYRLQAAVEYDTAADTKTEVPMIPMAFAIDRNDIDSDDPQQLTIALDTARKEKGLRHYMYVQSGNTLYTLSYDNPTNWQAGFVTSSLHTAQKFIIPNDFEFYMDKPPRERDVEDFRFLPNAPFDQFDTAFLVELPNLLNRTFDQGQLIPLLWEYESRGVNPNIISRPSEFDRGGNFTVDHPSVGLQQSGKLTSFTRAANAIRETTFLDRHNILYHAPSGFVTYREAGIL